MHPVLPEGLNIAYGGDLWFPPSGPERPYVIGNFVSTVDGVVSYRIAGKSGGGDISGFDEYRNALGSANTLKLGPGEITPVRSQLRYQAAIRGIFSRPVPHVGPLLARPDTRHSAHSCAAGRGVASDPRSARQRGVLRFAALRLLLGKQLRGA